MKMVLVVMATTGALAGAVAESPWQDAGALVLFAGALFAASVALRRRASAATRRVD